jgi:hypothetical protein
MVDWEKQFFTRPVIDFTGDISSDEDIAIASEQPRHQGQEKGNNGKKEKRDKKKKKEKVKTEKKEKKVKPVKKKDVVEQPVKEEMHSTAHGVSSPNISAAAGAEPGSPSSPWKRAPKNTMVEEEKSNTVRQSSSHCLSSLFSLYSRISSN